MNRSKPSLRPTFAPFASVGFLLGLAARCQPTSCRAGRFRSCWKMGSFMRRGQLCRRATSAAVRRRKKGRRQLRVLDAILIDTATPPTALVPQEADTPRQFQHGQFSLMPRSPGKSGATQPCAAMSRWCAVITRFWTALGQFTETAAGWCDRADQLLNYSLELRLATDRPTIQISRGDLAPWCRVDRAVIPFKPLGGELCGAAFRHRDSVSSDANHRRSVPGTAEDPLSGPRPVDCISDADVDAALQRVLLAIPDAGKPAAATKKAADPARQ